MMTDKSELLEATKELLAWYGPFNPTKHPPEINGAWLRLKSAIEALAPTTQGTDSGLAGELERMANGLRGSMWANRNEIIELLDKATTALRTDRKAVLEEAAKVADRESVLASTGRSCSARSRRETADHIAQAIRALAQGAGK